MTEYYAGLRFGPASKEAKRFIENLAKAIHPKHGNAFVKALGALIADLLRAESMAPGTRCYRQVHNDTFVDQPIGARGYNEALRLLKANGYLDRTPFGTCPVTGMLKTTRYWATGKLIKEAEAAGLHAGAIDAHLSRFPRPKKLKRPLVARTASRRSKKGVKVSGRRVKVDCSSSRARNLAVQVNDINAFIAEQEISPDWHYAFRRIFNDVDRPGFNWNSGGRLYSVGGGYQIQPSGERARITLNGEPTVEVDIKACFPTIIHAMKGVKFDPWAAYDGTPYPRAVIKAWVGMTLSKRYLPSAWTKKQVEEVFPEARLDANDFPIKQINAFMIKHMPIFNEWHKNTLHWTDLQFIESSAMIDCVWELAKIHGIPSLPVHDSIIVPVTKVERAEEVLKACFKRWVGVEPVLDRKGGRYG